MEKETFRASDDMKTFFEKLLALKEYAKEQSKEIHSAGCVWDFVYEQLEAIIKEKK